ncbi:MAG TPA: DUF4340 domain-containing protein [Thermoanaerobaculia bacterium]|jgi:hypothetical protein|nr:DUF4340 domain-containing protein [Thermoanaerobaculia bacterium]
MRPRTLLVLLVLVAGLGTFIWFYERELPSSEERAKLEKRVLQVEKEDVTAVTLQSESGTVRMEKVKLPAPAKQEEKKDEEEIDTTPETEWLLRQPLQARADAFAVDGLLDALANLEQTRVLDDVDARQAGLDKPRATVRLKTGEGSEGETILKIGAADPMGGSTLAGIEGRKGAFVVSDSILNEIRKEPGDWRDRQMYRGDRDQVQRITLSSGVVLVPRGDSFRLERPVADRADREKVDDLFAELSGLTAERFVNRPLGPPRAVVEVAFKQGPPVRIEVGAPVAVQEETPVESPTAPPVQARVGNQVFEARTRLAEIAARPAAEWRSQTLSGFDVFQVESATVQDEQGKLTLQRAEPDWKRGEETISYLPVSDFLFALVQARAERLLLPGELGISGKPALTVTLKGKDAGEETLTLYPPVAAGVPARAAGRDLVLLLPAGTLGEIQGKLAEVRKARPVQKQ